MPREKSFKLYKLLKEKSSWVRKETLKIHGIAPETRLASSLSAVEIFTVLYYGKIVSFDPTNPAWINRDRFIISKGHGAISFYPVLADLGFFARSELDRVSRTGSFLGSIPDCRIPGFETINGSLGHGLGVACGIALALKQRKWKEKVFILLGDGELFEGSAWEAIMFAGAHNLGNLIVILDNNKICMLDYCRKIIDLNPLDKKLKGFKWRVLKVNGHDCEQLYEALKRLKQDKSNKPKFLIADTVKGKGVSCLEKDPLCHIRSLNREEIELSLRGMSTASDEAI